MAGYQVAALSRLIEQFERMPGIGRKSAQRLAFYVLGLSDAEAKGFAQSILDAHEKIHRCKICCNLTDTELCSVCGNPARDSRKFAWWRIHATCSPLSARMNTRAFTMCCMAQSPP